MSFFSVVASGSLAFDPATETAREQIAVETRPLIGVADEAISITLRLAVTRRAKEQSVAELADDLWD